MKKITYIILIILLFTGCRKWDNIYDELSEKDCLEAFPIIKLGIELILDEEIEKKKREEKLKTATKELSLLREKHK